jgi:hypothetical protein
VLVDLGQELGLGAAGTGSVSLCRGHGYLKPQLTCP